MGKIGNILTSQLWHKGWIRHYMNRFEIKSSYYPKIPPNSYLQSKFHVTGAISTMETTSLHFPPNFCTCVMEIHSCVLKNIGPLRPLPYSHATFSADHSKQGIRYHWHCVILGWLTFWAAAKRGQSPVEQGTFVRLPVCLFVCLFVRPP